MDRSKWFARLALAAATVGVLVAAGLGSAAPYAYPRGDNDVITLFPDSAVYYGDTYVKDGLTSSYYNAYDEEDRIVSTVMLRTDGTILTHTNRYYDAAGNETVVEYIDHDTGAVDRSEKFYNADGNVESIRVTEQITGEIRLTEYTYDEQDRVVLYRVDEGEGQYVVSTSEYETLDNGGWIQEVEAVRQKAGGETISYTQHFEYDAQGNLLYNRTFNAMGNGQTSESWYRYEYDGDGNTVYYASLNGPDGPIVYEETNVYENGLLLEQTSRTPLDDGEELVVRSVYTYDAYGHKVMTEEFQNIREDVPVIITDYYLT